MFSVYLVSDGFLKIVCNNCNKRKNISMRRRAWKFPCRVTYECKSCGNVVMARYKKDCALSRLFDQYREN